MFSQLSSPAAKLFADLVHFFGKRRILFRIERVALPEHHEEELQSVNFPYGESHIGKLLRALQKCRRAKGFGYFDKQRIYFSTERVPMELRKGRMVLMPQEIGLFDSLQDGQQSRGGVLGGFVRAGIAT